MYNKAIYINNRRYEQQRYCQQIYVNRRYVQRSSCYQLRVQWRAEIEYKHFWIPQTSSYTLQCIRYCFVFLFDFSSSNYVETLQKIYLQSVPWSRNRLNPILKHLIHCFAPLDVFFFRILCLKRDITKTRFSTSAMTFYIFSALLSVFSTVSPLVCLFFFIKEF